MKKSDADFSTVMKIVEYNSKNELPSPLGSFKKNDSNKPDLSLVEPLLLEMYVEASEAGEKKYGRGNWRKAVLKDIIRPVSAVLRHFIGYTDPTTKFKHGFLNGEEKDVTDGQRHLSSAIWGLVMIQSMIDKHGFDAAMKIIREVNKHE